MMGRIAVAALVLLVLAAPAFARPATRAERAAMLEHALPVRAGDRPICKGLGITTLVSRYRPRTGVVFAGNSRRRERAGCSVGDGYNILRRPSRRSQRWRVAWSGSEWPPCRLISVRMARELRSQRFAGARGCYRNRPFRIIT